MWCMVMWFAFRACFCGDGGVGVNVSPFSAGIHMPETDSFIAGFVATGYVLGGGGSTCRNENSTYSPRDGSICRNTPHINKTRRGSISRKDGSTCRNGGSTCSGIYTLPSFYLSRFGNSHANFPHVYHGLNVRLVQPLELFRFRA